MIHQYTHPKKRNTFAPTRIFVSVVLFWVSISAQALSFKATDAVDYFFENEQATLTEDHFQRSRHFVSKTENSNPEYIIVIGHSDAKEKNGKKLSEKRALKVAQSYIDLGVPPHRIHAEGQGSKKPINTTDAQKNRRVEVEFVGNRWPDIRFEGFNWMPLWYIEGQTDSKNLLKKHIKPQTPLQVLQESRNVISKNIFSQKLALHSILTRDYAVLRTVSSQLTDCKTTQEDLSNLYLFALIWGDTKSQNILSRCQSSVDEFQRVAMFKSLFCRKDSLTLESTQLSNWVNLLQLNRSTFEKMSPTHMAALATCYPSTKRISWLLANGFTPAIHQKTAERLLFQVVSILQIESVRVLLDAGVDVQSRDEQDRTPLHYVTPLERRSFEPYLTDHFSRANQQTLWQLLLNRGADPEALDKTGKKPIAP